MTEPERRTRDEWRIPPACPHCGAVDLPRPAKPTLEVEPNGTLSCSTCGTNFRPPP